MAVLDATMWEFLEWIPAAIAALSSVVVFLIFLKRRITKVVLRVKAVIEKFDQHTEQLGDLNDKMSVVLAEVSPNGGSSIKDVVKRIDHRLYELELTSLTILDHEERGVFKTNSLGEIVWANRACATAFDTRRTDLLRFGWVSIVAPEQRALVTEEWENAMKLKRQVSIAFEILTNENERKSLVINAYPIMGNNQVFLGYIGTVNLQQ